MATFYRVTVSKVETDVPFKDTKYQVVGKTEDGDNKYGDVVFDSTQTVTTEVFEQTVEELRKLAKELAHKAEDLCPPSREKSLGFTHVETALMYYVKSVVLPR